MMAEYIFCLVITLDNHLEGYLIKVNFYHEFCKIFRNRVYNAY